MFDREDINVPQDDAARLNVWRASADGSNRGGGLTGTAFFKDHTPAWSPNGARIAEVTQDRRISTSATRRQIWTMAPDGTQRQLLTRTRGTTDSENYALWPTWSPDGTNIAFYNRVDFRRKGGRER